MSQHQLLNIIQSILWMANEYAETDPAYKPIINQAVEDLKSWQLNVHTLDKYQYIHSTKTGLTHAQRQKRRQQIAQYHRQNPEASVSTVAQLFNVGEATVNNAIREFKDDIFVVSAADPDKQMCFWWYNCHDFSQKSLDIVYDLMANPSLVDIATKYGLTRQRVHQIKMTAAARGAVFPTTNKEVEIKTCSVCGKPHERHGKTCSKECLKSVLSLMRKNIASQEDLKWSRLITHKYSCVGCGKQFDRTNYQRSISQAKGCDSPKYCSQKCYYNRTRDSTSPIIEPREPEMRIWKMNVDT